jgi:hypothetical protein
MPETTVVNSLAGHSVSVEIYDGNGPSYRLRYKSELGAFSNSKMGDKISQTFITNA